MLMQLRQIEVTDWQTQVASPPKVAASFSIILDDPKTLFVHAAEIVKRECVLLLSRQLIVPARLGVVLWHTLTGLVEPSEIEPRPGMALIGGLARPEHALGIIHRHIGGALSIDSPDNELRLDDAVFCGRQQQLERLCVLASLCCGRSLDERELRVS